jgi:hypothetical protein
LQNLLAKNDPDQEEDGICLMPQNNFDARIDYLPDAGDCYQILLLRLEIIEKLYSKIPFSCPISDIRYWILDIRLCLFLR